MFVEKANIRLADVIEMAQAEAEEVVEAFALESADPGFRKSVCIWRQQRCSQAADSQRCGTGDGNQPRTLLSRSWMRNRAPKLVDPRATSSGSVPAAGPTDRADDTSDGLRNTLRVPMWMNARLYANRMPEWRDHTLAERSRRRRACLRGGG